MNRGRGRREVRGRAGGLGSGGGGKYRGLQEGIWK